MEKHLRLIIENNSRQLQGQCTLKMGARTCTDSSGTECDPAEDESASLCAAVIMLNPGNVDLNSNKGVLIAKALVILSQDVPMHLMKVNTYPDTLKKGTTLGHCLSMASIRYPGSTSVANQGITKEKEITSVYGSNSPELRYLPD